MMFVVPCLGIIAVLMLVMIASGGRAGSLPPHDKPTPGEAALMAELREMKKRRILERGGSA